MMSFNFGLRAYETPTHIALDSSAVTIDINILTIYIYDCNPYAGMILVTHR